MLASDSPKPETIPTRPSPEMLPLSFTQERFWTLDQFDPRNPVYNRPILLQLQGGLAVEALQRALNEIMRRHEGLRAIFLSEKGHPRQVIQPPFNLPMVMTDLDQANREVPDEAIHRWVDQAMGRPFNLAQGPLLRVELLRLSPNHHLLLLVAHHILFDAWSARIFIREMVQLYDAFVEGRSSPLPDLAIQYPDFACWQRERFQSSQLQKEMSYWQTRLADALPYLELPVDHDRPRLLSHQGALCTYLFPDDLIARLKTLSREANVTLFMTLLAAFKILLHNYSGQTDIIVGSPVAGRTHTGLEPLIGVLFNTLVLRTDLSGDPTFRALLGRVRQTALEAYTHQSLPFEKLVEILNPPRGLSRTPIFQMMFNFENLVDAVPSSQYLTVAEVEFDHHIAYYEITVELMETLDGFKGLFFYKTDLFEAATIKRMIRHFETLLSGIVANPDLPISQLPLLTEAEQRQILVEWNNTDNDYPREMCLHNLFEQQVEQTPEAIAVIYKEAQLSYKELNEKANQLAHYLQKQGVGPESLVGLCVDRSLEMVIGLLGILKAGGAYVPLDPAFPRDRLAFMLADSQVPVLLTQQRLAALLPEHNAQVLYLDADWPYAGQANHVSDVKPTNLAYVIYTSGSTGRPKGVQISHQAAVNFLHAMRRRPGLIEKDVLLAVTTLSFDIALLELFLPIIVGARVVIVPREVAADGKRLQEALIDSKATVM